MRRPDDNVSYHHVVTANKDVVSNADIGKRILLARCGFV